MQHWTSLALRERLLFRQLDFELWFLELKQINITGNWFFSRYRKAGFFFPDCFSRLEEEGQSELRSWGKEVFLHLSFSSCLHVDKNTQLFRNICTAEGILLVVLHFGSKGKLKSVWVLDWSWDCVLNWRHAKRWWLEWEEKSKSGGEYLLQGSICYLLRICSSWIQWCNSPFPFISKRIIVSPTML